MERHLHELNAQDLADQQLRDLIHQRLSERTDYDEATDCWIYTGSWDRRGIAKVRVGSKAYTVTRVSAWLYIPGFELWDARWVYHAGECPNPACYNWSHLIIATNRAVAQAQMRLLGRFGSGCGRGRGRPGRRLNLLRAREVRRRLEAGEDPRALALEFGVRTIAITRIGDGRSWKE